MNKDRIIIILILVFFVASLIAGGFLVFQGRTPRVREGKIEGLRKASFQKGNLAVVYIYGPIQIVESKPIFGPRGGADYLVRKLKALRKDPHIKAVVLRINSPGGTVGAVQEIHSEILNLRKAGKKVVASLGDIAASGGYYLACATDKIVANPGTLTGSIGVLFPITNLEGLFEKLGIEVETVKSGKHKDIGSSSRALTEEEKKLLQELVDNAYQQFLEAVVEGRGEFMPGEKIEEICDGRIFTGEQAQGVGLVDELGNLDDSIKLAAKLAGIEGKVRIYEEREGWRRVFMRLGEKFFQHPWARLSLPKSGILEYRYRPEY